MRCTKIEYGTLVESEKLPINISFNAYWHLTHGGHTTAANDPYDVDDNKYFAYEFVYSYEK